MLVQLRLVMHIVAALSVCGGCSVLFDSEGRDASTNVDKIDADFGTITEAKINVGAPTCGENIYEVSGVGSITAGGTAITEYRWTLNQGGELLATFTGSADIPVPTSTHVLGGTVGTFNVNPSLLSAPDLLRVSISGTSGFNQVFQASLVIQNGEEYELSFVASSDVPGELRAELLEDADPFGGMGLSTLFSTGITPTRYVIKFIATKPSTDGRFRFAFPETGGFWIDNVELRQVGLQNLLQNDRFGVALDPWRASLPMGGGTAVIQPIPPFLGDFPDMTLRLVVVDSSGTTSEAATAIIDRTLCNE